MSRRDSRIYAMEIIYQKELETYDNIVQAELKLKINDEIFGNTLIESMETDKDSIVEKINSCLMDWSFARLGYLERSILLLGFTEMSKFQEIPLNVSLDEWVDIAKDYCGEEAKKLINGVLNNYKNILIKEKVRIE
ncbi:MAG: N utilization substance protein B [Fusobacteria bacterium]|nr:MAG: N utilization substance protein B [Fusobacteriota bacterium]KAF0230000.1 MAG: N utilization substance protein [Fusobacteriota bacterium]